MGSSSKRINSSVTLNSNKKIKKSNLKAVEVVEPSPFDSEEDFEDDEGGENGFEDLEAALDDLENGLEEDSEEGDADEDEEDEDSEVNEFESEDLENDLGLEEGEEEDDDLIGDDGEDLMANLDNGEEEEDDSEEEDDEEEDEDEEDSNSGIPAPTSFKKANVRNSKAPAPLKPAELRALAFAELTASPISTLISTQVSTFLKPISPSAPATSTLQPLLKLLHSHITSLPSQPLSNLREMKKRGIVVPKLEGDEAKWSRVEMGWEKPRPEEVRIVGSWAWGGSIKVKGEYFVDMAIAIPETLLQPKDYLYPRFLYKSTHYLVTLASLLPSTLGPVSLSYTSLPLSQGFSLEIRSARKTDTTEAKVGLSVAKGAVLRLRIVSPLEFFPAAKLSPLSNISRPSLLPSSSTSTSSTTPFAPTPLQCSSLLLSSLSLQTTHLKYLHALTLSHPSFSSTVRLLSSWANSRSHGTTLGLSFEFWAWCVARSLNWGSAMEIKKGTGGLLGGETGGGEAWAGWRNVVEWLAGINWVEGVFFRVEGEGAYEKDDFRKAFSGKPLFVDPTGTVNLAAGIDLATLDMLKQDAKTTIALLLGGVDDEDRFQGAFTKEIKIAERFDNYATITIPTKLISSIDSDLTLDFPSKLTYLISSISSTLLRALGSRSRAFQLNYPTSSPLLLSSPSSKSNSITLTLGILLDSAEAGRLVDQGPSAEDEAACEEFRTFWGSRSELRRFKDGAILESVVWEEVSESGLGQQRNKVVSKVIDYILGSRYSIPSSNISVFAGSMDHLLVEPFSIRRAIYLEDSVSNNKGFGNIMGAFDAISKELKGLPDLPLAITSVQPSSSGLRYSTIFTPSPRRLKNFERFPDSTQYIEIHDVLLTMEGSGRWPDDLEGVQKIKAAFLAKIAEGLSNSHTIVKAELAFDLSSRPIDDNVALEILTSSGYAFRARIFYDRSLLLIKSRIAKAGLPSTPSTSDTSLELYNKRFAHSPRHHAALATLQHHFTSYSPTVRLVKRWFSSHMLTPHISNHHIELLAASVFIDPSSLHEPPHSGAAGFARVMAKLADWNWKDEPLLVCLYSFSIATNSGRRPTFPSTERKLAKDKFEHSRVTDLTMSEFAWRICTEEDVEGKVWGRKTDKVAAGRVRALARVTLSTLNSGLVEGSLVVEQLFTTPLDGYNFIIHLDPSKIPRHFQSLSPISSALSSSNSSILSGSFMGELETEDDEQVLLAWDPVAEFVKELKLHYSSTCLLFHSPDGTPLIAGIWNPTSETVRPWKVGIGFPIKPVVESNGKTKVIIDKDVIIREIERLGQGLVLRVEKRS